MARTAFLVAMLLTIAFIIYAERKNRRLLDQWAATERIQAQGELVLRLFDFDEERGLWFVRTPSGYTNDFMVYNLSEIGNNLAKDRPRRREPSETESESTESRPANEPDALSPPDDRRSQSQTDPSP